MTRIKLRQLSSLAPALVFFLFAGLSANAQCPQIEAVMIDACGTEQLNEFVIIRSGGGFNTADIELDYDANNNILAAVNNDININNGNYPPDPTPCGLIAGNAAAYAGCANLIAVGPGVTIPPNSTLVLQTSAGSSNSTYSFASLCGAGQCVYVISSSCTRSAGAFTNGPGPGTRTIGFSIAGGCLQTVTYNQASVTGSNGAYYLPLTNTYGNAGCVAPPAGPAPPAPNIAPIADVTSCGPYVLPSIAGANLTPNAAYFTGSGGTGTKYLPGVTVPATTLLYAYDRRGPAGCSDQEQFTVTVDPLPVVQQPSNVLLCGSQPVSIPLTGTPGAVFNWTNTNTATGLGAAGAGNINFVSAAVAGPQVALITVTPSQASCTGIPVAFTVTVTPLADSFARAAVHVFLQGPYVNAESRMHDSLRVHNLVPLLEPYTGLPGFAHLGGGGEQTTPTVLAVTGSDAVVDWVFLELRDALTPALVLATRSALLQRDGDVVEVDGLSAVTFGMPAGQSYYLAVRHRNHLGVQLGQPKYYPVCTVVGTDFRTLPPEGFYAHNGLNPAQRLIGSRYTLWAGNGRIDDQLKYNGSVNDRNAILSVVGLATPNAIVPGYLPADCNLDGVVKYNGSANDRNVLLGNVGVATPSAVVYDQTAQ